MSDLLNSASLVLIPSGYKEDTVYSVVPSDGSGDLSFTRASNGTRVNSAGLVEDCPWNLLQYSEDFANAWWGKDVGSSVDSNVATAPNGTTTADRLNYTSAGQAIYRVISFSGTNKFSVYLKGEGANIGKQIQLEIGAIGGFNVTLTGDWIRHEVEASNATSVAIKKATSGQADAVLAWGIQVNSGSTAKPYFPTTDRLNVPRLTYQNGGGGCPSLLLEKQSTNLITYSEDFTNAAWLRVGGNVDAPAITANQTISPDGTQNADKIVFPSVQNSGDFSVVYRASDNLSGTNTTSIYLKGENGGEQVYLYYFISSYNNKLCTLTTEWQRFDLTFEGGAASYWHIGVDLRSGSGQSAKPAQTIYAWGAQLEASSYPTSYIGPTTSASATRVADACFKTGISSLIGQTEGTVFFDFTVDTISAQTNDPVLWYMKGGGTGERYIQLLSNENLRYIEFNGAVIASITKSGLTVGRHKCAIAYANNDMTFYVDGVQIGTDTSGTPSGFSEFGLQYYNAAFNGEQKVNQTVIFPTRLTNAELASLTTL